MIAITPFPLEDLVKRPCVESGDGAEAKELQPGSKQSPDLSSSMIFSPFGADSGKASDPDRIYTAEDMAQAVDDARRRSALEAEAALRSAMANEIEQRQCDMLAAIRDQLAGYRAAFEDELVRMADVSQRLAVALSEAVIPKAIERQPLADIADVLKVTLARLAHEPSIILRLPVDLVESGEALLAGLAKEAGFTGNITTVADPRLSEGDVELSWKGGAVDRRLDRLQAEALDLVGHWLPECSERNEKNIRRADVPSDSADEATIGPMTQELQTSGPSHER